MPYEALLQNHKFFTAIRASSNMQAVSKWKYEITQWKKH